MCQEPESRKVFKLERIAPLQFIAKINRAEKYIVGKLMMQG